MSLKETFFNKIFNLRNLFIGANVVLLFCFLAAVGKDQVREWKRYQKEYYSREKKRLQGELDKTSADEEKLRYTKLMKLVSGPAKIQQVMAPQFDRFDRCLTCHVGHDPAVNPGLTTPYDDQPYAAKPNDIHKSHPIDKFACTVCHEGQGLATTAKAAHGEVKHWEKPLLRGAYLQASCFKCHGDVDDEKAMPYTAVWRRGQALFQEKGCIGCHQIHGQGGPVSVDLAEDTADKPLSRIDFTYTGLRKEDQTLANWIKLHFVKPPQELVPGDPEGHFNDEPIAPSGMPFFNLSNEDADALVTYILSLAKDTIPAEYARPAPPKEEPKFKSPVEHGRYVYDKYGCAGCHGADARGGIPNFNSENGVEPDIRKSVGTYTRDELRAKIQHGVLIVGKKEPKGPTPPLYMPAWKDKIKGQELEDLLTYLFSIGDKQEEW